MKEEKSNKKAKTNKSQVMREMFDNGSSIVEISKLTKSHYSFVYETIKKYCRKSNKSFTTNLEERDKKSDLFRKMYDEGSTIGQIAKCTNSNYSYVWTVIEKYRNS